MREENISQFIELSEVLVTTGEADRPIWCPHPRVTFSVRHCYDWWRREPPSSITIKAAEI
ncbi:hypothetical protein QJS10_CPA01g02345 [Acorus calamus]|uniref:Uncharacterized protein n=1 Tax=Acorus calamus TaxID=4465 RepID=A0AAV9FGQ5_ACOCL|nr:hypothetical protein QJS10_CPA01g02345 [Acorus calamus]